MAYVGVQPGNPMTAAEILEQWRGGPKLGARNISTMLEEAWPSKFTRSSWLTLLAWQCREARQHLPRDTATQRLSS